jgi:hypothetical protein
MVGALLPAQLDESGLKAALRDRDQRVSPIRKKYRSSPASTGLFLLIGKNAYLRIREMAVSDQQTKQYPLTGMQVKRRDDKYPLSAQPGNCPGCRLSLGKKQAQGEKLHEKVVPVRSVPGPRSVSGRLWRFCSGCASRL